MPDGKPRIKPCAGLEAVDNDARIFFEKELAMESTGSKVDTQELREKMEALKQDFADVAKTAKERAVQGTADWVKEHPFAAIGIAAGVGFLIGLLVGRKSA